LINKVEEFLNMLASSKIPDGKKLSGVNHLPVFKIRCNTASTGKRKGARIIYYKNESTLIALFIYLKSDTTNISYQEIINALKKENLMK